MTKEGGVDGGGGGREGHLVLPGISGGLKSQLRNLNTSSITSCYGSQLGVILYRCLQGYIIFSLF